MDFMSNFFFLTTNSDVIFVIPWVDLHDIILISSKNSNLEKSTSSTAEVATWKASQADAVGAIELKIESHSFDNWQGTITRHFTNKAHPSIP